MLKKEIAEEVLVETAPEVQTTQEDNQGIEINAPINLKTELPLVVKLPADASKAQIAYANMLNSYAYQNPKKWEMKKDDQILPGGGVVKGFITRLKELKNAPDPVDESPLKINNTGL
jgi:hypothetical protein